MCLWVVYAICVLCPLRHSIVNKAGQKKPCMPIVKQPQLQLTRITSMQEIGLSVDSSSSGVRQTWVTILAVPFTIFRISADICLAPLNLNFPIFKTGVMTELTFRG